MDIHQREELTGLEIAVIGMAGRFPAAADIDELWKKLVAGEECIRFYPDEHFRQIGFKEETINNPKYVKGYGWMDGIADFDAPFFGYLPLEAEIMDPQVRLFHECAHEAVENAGYDSFSYRKLIGLYAGAAAGLNWQIMTELSGKNTLMGWFLAKQLHDKDFMSTRIAYKLNLKGPAVTVNTACSTSLVAVHLACQGLLSGDCDMALAGAVSFYILQEEGYTYEEGLIFSPDGHCRAFDAEAKGSNFGNAGAVVLLKRLEDAIDDGDTIHAVIRGSAINNDGNRKAGYTAPSIEGQADAVKNAYRMAEIDPTTIGYIEAHGTGTPLGDPVEIEALKAAFKTDKKQFCRIGSIKTNVGHLEAAAGVTGLIKTVMTLKNRLIPPSLFFKTPNPQIDFENSPFMVNAKLHKWEPRDGEPLRAGVSSFGIGGTNAHVVLEEWIDVETEKTDLTHRPHLLFLSAASKEALDQAAENMAAHLEKHPAINMADACYTLQVGRRIHKHRLMTVCRDAAEAVELLRSNETGKTKTHVAAEGDRPLVFLFSGLGGEYVNMGRGLYDREPVFRDVADRCFRILETVGIRDLKEILYPGDETATVGEGKTWERKRDALRRPEISQPAVFVFEYALAQLLIHWGFKPEAMMGYSFGEYVAACTAGVFSVEDALALVVERSRLVQTTPEGAMLSVPLPMIKVRPMLDKRFSVAIDNGPSTIVSGTQEHIAELETLLKERRIMTMRVQTARALHSHLMESVVPDFKRKLGEINFNGPNIKYISNVTGTWITDAEAGDPDHWCRHLTGTVRFADGMKELLKEKGAVFLEIGPGRDISVLTKRHVEDAGADGFEVLNMVKHPNQGHRDSDFLFNRLGKLWLYGQPIDWGNFYAHQQRRRVPLPTYPFQRRRYWIEKSDMADFKMPGKEDPSIQKKDPADWYYVPSWKRMELPAASCGTLTDKHCWLIFMDQCGLGDALVEQLHRIGQTVRTVAAGTMFMGNEGRYIIDPRDHSHYKTLLNALEGEACIPSHILHLWEVTGGDTLPEDPEDVREALLTGYHSIINLAREIGALKHRDDIRLTVVTDHLHEINGGEGTCPHKATLLGPVKIVPMEYHRLKCRSIDIVSDAYGDHGTPDMLEQLTGRILEEASGDSADILTAYRGPYRWVLDHVPYRLENKGTQLNRLKENGVYLITGGLGGIGLLLARRLAETIHPRLVLTGRSKIPPRDSWDQYLADDNSDDSVKGKILAVCELERLGAEVLVFAADVADIDDMEDVVSETAERFGTINGVIHCAGLADGEMIALRIPGTVSGGILAKVSGTMVLDAVLKDDPPDFMVLCSSISSIIPIMGQVGYCAANSFLDAYAHYRNSQYGRKSFTVAIDWERWQHTGIAQIAENRHKELTGDELRDGLTPTQGVDTFERILADRLTQVAVSTRDLNDWLSGAVQFEAPSHMDGMSQIGKGKQLRPRPDMDCPYAAPETDTQKQLADIWAQFFGLEKIGIDDDFFELGGDSLKALILLPMIHKQMNVEITVAEFFEYHSIRNMSQFIDQSENRDYVGIAPSERKEYYPLSYAQKRIYVLQQADPTSTQYNEFLIAPNDEGVDKDSIENAVRSVIRRQESLRTAVITVHDEPVQVVRDECDFSIQYWDYSESQTAEAVAAVQKLAGGFVRPFDLAAAPLLRVGIVNLPNDKSVFLVDMHHIITDGLSMNIFLEDVIYEIIRRPVSPLRIQYRDYAQWQNSGAYAESLNRQEHYWLEQFAQEPAELKLPLDFKRRGVFAFAERIDKPFEQPVADGFTRLTEGNKVTPFMLLLAVYNVLLAKISGSEDVVVGTLTAGRNHFDLQRIIGMFVNTLALRNRPQSHLTFRQFLLQVKDSLLAAFENQDYPFEQLVDKVVKRREPGRNPLFDVAFSYMAGTGGISDSPESAAPQSAANLDADEPERGKAFDFSGKSPAKFDLIMDVAKQNNTLTCGFKYNTSLFKQETVSRLLGYFMDICAIVVDNPDITLADITFNLDIGAATTGLTDDDDGDFGF